MSFNDFLKSQELNIVTFLTKPPKGSMSAVKQTIQVFPPMNTNIDLSSLKVYKRTELMGVFALKKTIINIPTHFSWAPLTNPDGSEYFKSLYEKELIPNGSKNPIDPTFKIKKQLITPPQNQGTCGSCWAISTCGIVSDLFVISGITTSNPNLSTTSLLACNDPTNPDSGNSQCQGGFPAKAATFIHTKGITSNNCVDYSWCLKNPQCSGIKASGGSEFNNPKVGDLSSLIPTCGCYNGKTNFNIYKIDEPTQLSIGLADQSGSIITPASFENSVKNCIINNGPVSGCYIIFKNFFSFGKKQDINNGIYLESIDYDNSTLDNIVFYSDSSKYIVAGGHAVAIIGWGEENIVTKKSKPNTEKVKYWICRNSWGDKWATQGYFKMGMYPNNLLSQFDIIATNTVVDANGNQVSTTGGGILMMSVSQSPTTSVLPPNNYDAKKGLLNQDPKYYLQDSQPQIPQIPIKQKDEKTNNCPINCSNCDKNGKCSNCDKNYLLQNDVCKSDGITNYTITQPSTSLNEGTILVISVGVIFISFMIFGFIISEFNSPFVKGNVETPSLTTDGFMDNLKSVTNKSKTYIETHKGINKVFAFIFSFIYAYVLILIRICLLIFTIPIRSYHKLIKNKINPLQPILLTQNPMNKNE